MSAPKDLMACRAQLDFLAIREYLAPLVPRERPASKASKEFKGFKAYPAQQAQQGPTVRQVPTVYQG